MEITAEDIYNYYQLKSLKDNNEKAKSIIEELEKNFKYTFYFDNDTLKEEEETEVEDLNKMLLIKQYSDNHHCVNSLYSLLTKYNYNMRIEIIEAMMDLSRLVNFNHNKTIINKFLSSPVIDDITFDGYNLFTIISEELGTFQFTPASLYLKNTKSIMTYLTEANFANRCHKNLEKLSSVFSNDMAIVSLCDSYFLEYHYHSYMQMLKDNIIVDLTIPAVIENDVFTRLHTPKEVLRIKGGDIFLQTGLNKVKPYDCYDVLKLALHQQLKNLTSEEKQAILTYKNSFKH